MGGVVSKTKADGVGGGGGGGGGSVMPLRGETLQTPRGGPGYDTPRGNS